MPLVYMLRCRDGSYYVGSTSETLDRRINEHRAGVFKGYTSSRLPVRLVWSQEFDRITDAIAAERQIKGWSRAKKEALIRGDWNEIARLAARSRAASSFETTAPQSPQDDAIGLRSTNAPRRPEGEAVLPSRGPTGVASGAREV